MTSAGRVLRNAGVQVVAEVVSKGATLVLYGVFAREVGKAGFGEFSFILSLGGLLLVFAGPGAEDVLAREVTRDRARLRQLLWGAVSIKGGLGGIAVLAAVAIVAVGHGAGHLAATMALLALSLLTDALAKSVHAVFVVLEDMRPVAAALMLQRITTAVVGIAVLLSGGGVVTVCAVFLSGSVVGALYACWRLRRRIAIPRFELSGAAWSWLFRAALPLGVSSVFTIVLFRVDTVILAVLDTDVAVGLYGAAYRLLDATLFLSFAFVTAMIPTLARANRDTSPSLALAYSSALKAAVAMLFPLGTVFALFADPITRLLYGDDFADAATALRLLGGTAALFGVSQLSTATLIFQNRQAWVPWVTGSLLAFNVALNFALIPSWSLAGAAFATTATELIRAGVTVYLVHRLAGRIPGLRVLLSPVLGCVAMVGVWLALGAGLAVIPIALAVYGLTLLGLDHRLYPRDLRIVLDAVARRGSAAPVAGGPSGS